MFDRFAAWISGAALLILVFSAGLGFAYWDLPPNSQFQWAVRQLKSLVEEPSRLMPVKYDYAGVRIHDREAVAPGTTFITSHFPEFGWHGGARLIDVDGNVLHSWGPDPKEIFDTRIKYPYMHGSYLYPNGDILANYSFIGLARISACGEVLWTHSDLRPHHSVSVASDGTIWVSGNRRLDGRKGRDEKIVSALSFPVHEDLFVQLSPDGEVLRSISSIEALDRSGLQEVVMRSIKRRDGDIFHLNDVEPLSPEMADEYPLFEAGDIVVSMRDIHMVAVLDPDTLQVKWHSNSDTLFQHDPDFIGDGWIGIFDNRFDRTENGSILGGTRIIAVRPHTGERKVLFPTEASPPFYTKWSGKWQQLSNGNMLLTEARAGHALEVDRNGKPVWEWTIEKYDEKQVPEVMEATRYPYTAEDVAAWKCP